MKHTLFALAPFVHLGASLALRQTGKVTYAGVNIAGCDFGCNTDGYCSGSDCDASGPSKMQHFASNDGLNMFRLPVGWQYLVNHQLGGTLDENFMPSYDALVNGCLQAGAYCIVDIHNYARWDGNIVGQSGSVTDDHLVNVWTQLVSRYKDPKMVYGIMNEPHDLDMNTWAATVQKVVNAIRATAPSNIILMPGTSYTAAGGFAQNSAPYLENIKNPDGSFNGLVYDVHTYYDDNNSGTSTSCTKNHIDDAFSPLADYLHSKGRQALLSETGGGNGDDCISNICAALDFLNQNSDAYLGWTGWAAGSFGSDYALNENPDPNTGADQALVAQCIAGKFH